MTPSVDDQLRGARWILDPNRYIAARLSPEAATAAAAIIAEHNQPFQAIVVDRDEITLITSYELFELAAHRFSGIERGSIIYRVITLDVVFALDVVGVLARITPALADAGIPILAISAFSRDHLLVPEEHAESALRVLEALTTG